MDAQAVAAQLISALGENPELLSQFVEHPYSTTAQAAGTEAQISKSDMSKVLTQVAAQACGQKISSSETDKAADLLLGKSGGSIHTLAKTLFGDVSAQPASATGQNGTSVAEILAKSVMAAAAAHGVSTLLSGFLGSKKGEGEGGGVDLSGLAGLAQAFLKK